MMNRNWTKPLLATACVAAFAFGCKDSTQRAAENDLERAQTHAERVGDEIEAEAKSLKRDVEDEMAEAEVTIEARMSDLDREWEQIEARAHAEKLEAKSEYREMKADIDRRFHEIQRDLERADDHAEADLRAAIDALADKLDEVEDRLDDA